MLNESKALINVQLNYYNIFYSFFQPYILLAVLLNKNSSFETGYFYIEVFNCN